MKSSKSKNTNWINKINMHKKKKKFNKFFKNIFLITNNSKKICLINSRRAIKYKALKK